jgi:P27 family predicted phage terminase small subunit
MARGRPPKSEALRRAQGLRQHRKKAGKESKPAEVESIPPAAIEAPSRVAVPAWLSEGARKAWRHASPPLMRQGLLTDADSIAFGRYCEWLAEYEGIQSRRRRTRKVVTKTKSKHVKNMERIDKTFQALMMLDKRLSEYEDRFGMNPRERLAILAKMAAGHHVPPQPPAKPELEPGESRIITPLAASSPVGILNTRPH